MSDDGGFDKATAEAVRAFSFIAAGVLGVLVAMFLWGAGHRALEEYDHWACARTCGVFGVEKVGGYADCECQSKEAKDRVDDMTRMLEARRALDEQLAKLRRQATQ